MYVVYIVTTPEKLWQALTDPKMTAQYWGHKNVSDWKVGSTWKHQRTFDNSWNIDGIGKIVESAPPKRLVLTWGEGKAGEKPSRLAFDIDPLPHTVRLTVIHDELEPGSGTLEGIYEGWPSIVFSLKTMLESGKSLSFIFTGSPTQAWRMDVAMRRRECNTNRGTRWIHRRSSTSTISPRRPRSFGLH